MRIHPVHIAAGLASVVGVASGQPVAILTDIAPGNTLVDTAGATLTIDRFDRPEGSASGEWWFGLVRATGDTSFDAFYVLGNTAAGTTQVVLRENTTEVEPGRVADSVFDRRVGVNDSGEWAMTVSVGGATTDDEVVVFGDSVGAFTVPFREGQTVAGSVFGASNQSPQVRNDGSLSFVWQINGSLDAVLADDGTTVRAIEGGVGPANRPGTTWNSIANTEHYESADGTDWMIRSTLSGTGISATNDTVLVVNNNVVLQENDTVGGNLSPVDTFSARLSKAGQWTARGNRDDGSGFAIIDGVVVGDDGLPVNGDIDGELWDGTVWTGLSNSTFFAVELDSAGNSVIAGFTNNADTRQNAVWIYNGTTEILRTGDAIDIDADGSPDNFFVAMTNLNSASLTPLGAFLGGGSFYTTVDVADAAGVIVGEAFIRVPVAAACNAADFAEPLGELNVFDILGFFTAFGAADPAADIDRDSDRDIFDIFAFFAAFGAGC